MISFIKKYYIEIAVALVFIAGLYFRIYGLKNNYSFWVDEASTARFGRAILESNYPKIQTTGYSEEAYYTTHYLTGYFFKLFGVSEYTARLPEVIIGSLVILATFLLGKELFGKQVGFASCLFVAFSYIQITWSRQARGYVILELFFIMALFFLYRFVKYVKTKDLLFLLLFLILSYLTHPLGLILVPIVFVLFLENRKSISILFKVNKSVLFIFIFVSASMVFLLRGFIFSHLFFALEQLFDDNKFISYYHSLFWRQYPVFIFLMFLGFLILMFNGKRKEFNFFLIALLCYFLMVCFFNSVPFEKYIFPVFPLIFIISSFSLKQISSNLFKSGKSVLFFVLVGFIVINGNKFTLKPKTFYSMNIDMKEIPEIDYKGIYMLVKEKTLLINKKDFAVVEIDADAPAWYLGEGIAGYIPTNDKSTLFDPNRGYKIIGSLEEFKKVKEEYRYGFINLIEHNFRFYPEGLVEYARLNLKLERKDQYAPFSPDWNHWPVELYSWGLEETKKK